MSTPEVKFPATLEESAPDRGLPQVATEPSNFLTAHAFSLVEKNSVQAASASAAKASRSARTAAMRVTTEPNSDSETWFEKPKTWRCSLQVRL